MSRYPKLISENRTEALRLYSQMIAFKKCDRMNKNTDMTETQVKGFSVGIILRESQDHVESWLQVLLPSEETVSGLVRV